jgi:hypothetical protein
MYMVDVHGCYMVSYMVWYMIDTWYSRCTCYGTWLMVQAEVQVCACLICMVGTWYGISVDG